MRISTKGRYALRLLVDVAENQTGGYTRLKDAARRQEISEKYLEIIVRALVRDGCPLMDGCPTMPLWQGLDKVISEYLEGVTLADLLRTGGEDLRPEA